MRRTTYEKYGLKTVVALDPDLQIGSLALRYRNAVVMKTSQRHLYHFYQAAVAIYISILLICFCSFDLCSPILEKDSFIETFYIVLSCPIK